MPEADSRKNSRVRIQALLAECRRRRPPSPATVPMFASTSASSGRAHPKEMSWKSPRIHTRTSRLSRQPTPCLNRRLRLMAATLPCPRVKAKRTPGTKLARSANTPRVPLLLLPLPQLLLHPLLLLWTLPPPRASFPRTQWTSAARSATAPRVHRLFLLLQLPSLPLMLLWVGLPMLPQPCRTSFMRLKRRRSLGSVGFVPSWRDLG
mmetsp:Transcript_60800/g.128690  ORF Transcript_60800/g.128690 Transcript_60800/m.128690 type:complete len:207 (+) Transcript_60800:1238-1858(+)